jgi:hypothetical protein
MPSFLVQSWVESSFMTIPHMHGMFFTSDSWSCREGTCLCYVTALFRHFLFVRFLAVWAVDAQWAPWGVWLCALLSLLVCARQPALLVLPAAEELGPWSQRSRHGPYWKMWVSIHNPWKQTGVWILTLWTLSSSVTHSLNRHIIFFIIVQICRLFLSFCFWGGYLYFWDRVMYVDQAVSDSWSSCLRILSGEITVL